MEGKEEVYVRILYVMFLEWLFLIFYYLLLLFDDVFIFISFYDLYLFFILFILIVLLVIKGMLWL